MKIWQTYLLVNMLIPVIFISEPFLATFLDKYFQPVFQVTAFATLFKYSSG